MKKIMFNDRYCLTQAVLEGRKKQTRRIISNKFHTYLKVSEEKGYKPLPLKDCSTYKVGEVVAIAQAYKDIFEEDSAQGILGHPTVLERNACDTAGWSNKMFVKAKSMKHHIKITNVRVERLQDISEEDCLAEGIEKGEFTNTWDTFFFREGQNYITAKTAREAYASLIDKVGKKGTWESNPWVFVYEFELVD